MPSKSGTPVEGSSRAGGDQGRGPFAHMYAVLTVEEMADRMKCTPQGVSERKAAGEIFAAWAAGREALGYPVFQLDERLNKALLKQVILECWRWDASPLSSNSRMS